MGGTGHLKHSYDFFGTFVAFSGCCMCKISGLNEAAQVGVYHLPQLREFDPRFAGKDGAAELTFQELIALVTVG